MKMNRFPLDQSMYRSTTGRKRSVKISIWIFSVYNKNSVNYCSLVWIFFLSHIILVHFFSSLLSPVIQILGEQLKLRQQVIATATVYFKRFYARNSLKCIDPLLLAPTCVFLSSKVEEFGVISGSRLLSTCQTVGKEPTQGPFYKYLSKLVTSQIRHLGILGGFVNKLFS